MLAWVNLGPHPYGAVAGEQTGLAPFGADKPLPEGSTEQVMPTLECFACMRRGHPAADDWTRQTGTR